MSGQWLYCRIRCPSSVPHDCRTPQTATYCCRLLQIVEDCWRLPQTAVDRHGPLPTAAANRYKPPQTVAYHHKKRNFVANYNDGNTHKIMVATNEILFSDAGSITKSFIYLFWVGKLVTHTNACTNAHTNARTNARACTHTHKHIHTPINNAHTHTHHNNRRNRTNLKHFYQETCTDAHLHTNKYTHTHWCVQLFLK